MGRGEATSLKDDQKGSPFYAMSSFFSLLLPARLSVIMLLLAQFIVHSGSAYGTTGPGPTERDDITHCACCLSARALRHWDKGLHSAESVSSSLREFPYRDSDIILLTQWRQSKNLLHCFDCRGLPVGDLLQTHGGNQVWKHDSPVYFPL